MAEDRRARLQRIQKVQEQLHRAETWHLVELQRQLDALEHEQRDLVAALNADDALQGLFLDAMARRLRPLGDRARAVEELRQEQAVRVKEAAARAVVADRLLDRAEQDAQRTAERRSLEEAIGRLAAQAPRKIVGG